MKTKALRLIPDERGFLMEILRADDAELFTKFGQVYVSATYPGVVKAWHYHQRQVDNFACVAGMVKLVLVDTRADSPTNGAINEFFVGTQNPMLVQVPNLVYHGWKSISPDVALVVNVPTEPYHYGEPGRVPASTRTTRCPMTGPARMVSVLVTGGAGFIGSNFVRYALRQHPDWRVTTLDKLTYAGRRENLHDVMDDPRHAFVHGDIADAAVSGPLVEQSEVVVHFAAETHVDRSIMSAGDFIRTDVEGTFVLLEAARRAPALRRFVQISTDEVYGSVASGASRETDELKPRNPYAASKAGADRLAYSYWATYESAGDRDAGVEQLRSVSVPGEGHPAVCHQRHRRPIPCRSMATGRTSATGCTSTTTAARSTC